jgi:hypothetical protein
MFCTQALLRFSICACGNTRTIRADISPRNIDAIVSILEQFTNVETAIAREKEIKSWRRKKKEKLVESMDPSRKDRAADWYPKGLMKDGVPVGFSKAKT